MALSYKGRIIKVTPLRHGWNIRIVGWLRFQRFWISRGAAYAHAQAAIDSGKRPIRAIDETGSRP